MEALKPCPFCHDLADALASALVAMKLASALPGVSDEYDFEPVIAEVEAVIAAWNRRPVEPGPESEAVARIIDPEAFAKYDADYAKGCRHSSNMLNSIGPMNIAREKAAAILSTLHSENSRLLAEVERLTKGRGTYLRAPDGTEYHLTIDQARRALAAALSSEVAP